MDIDPGMYCQDLGLHRMLAPFEDDMRPTCFILSSKEQKLSIEKLLLSEKSINHCLRQQHYCGGSQGLTLRLVRTSHWWSFGNDVIHSFDASGR